MIKKTHSTQTNHTHTEVAQAVALFFAAKRVMRTKLAHGKKRDPSTWLRVETMKFIADRGEPKMKELADYLSITAPSVTTLVNGLIRSGFVKTAPDTHDRRASRLMLTKKGEHELSEALQKGIALFGELFSILSPKELKGFTRALKRITETDV